MTQAVRMVQCVLLKKEAPGLERPVYPGDLGARIWRNVSKEAWQRWIAHQTMLINEYRLVAVEPKARKFNRRCCTPQRHDDAARCCLALASSDRDDRAA